MKRVTPESTAVANMSTPRNQQPVPQREMQLQPSYATEIPFPESEHPMYECMLNTIGAVIGLFGTIPCCLCCPNPFKTIPQGTVGLVTRFGKWYKSLDPGLYRINLVSENIQTVDIRIRIEDIPRQFIMTKDNVSISIDSVLYWKIVDPYVSTFLVQNVQKALIERTQTTLRQILGSRTLQDCVENRDTIAHEIQAIIEEPAHQWGIDICDILIKDLMFSTELLESLSSAAKAKRVGESKVIAAQAEVDAAKLMREAADILNTPAAMQIRYLETMASMSKSAETKVIFMPSAGMTPEDAMNVDNFGTKPNKRL